ncbi:hypothetical protein F5Y15DRAFT_426750, partial [Xylariaceae sp. FL0016]
LKVFEPLTQPKWFDPGSPKFVEIPVTAVPEPAMGSSQHEKADPKGKGKAPAATPAPQPDIGLHHVRTNIHGVVTPSRSRRARACANYRPPYVEDCSPSIDSASSKKHADLTGKGRGKASGSVLLPGPSSSSGAHRYHPSFAPLPPDLAVMSSPYTAVPTEPALGVPGPSTVAPPRPSSISRSGIHLPVKSTHAPSNHKDTNSDTVDSQLTDGAPSPSIFTVLSGISPSQRQKIQRDNDKAQDIRKNLSVGGPYSSAGWFRKNHESLGTGTTISSSKPAGPSQASDASQHSTRSGSSTRSESPSSTGRTPKKRSRHGRYRKHHHQSTKPRRGFLRALLGPSKHDRDRDRRHAEKQARAEARAEAHQAKLARQRLEQQIHELEARARPNQDPDRPAPPSTRPALFYGQSDLPAADYFGSSGSGESCEYSEDSRSSCPSSD